MGVQRGQAWFESCAFLPGAHLRAGIEVVQDFVCQPSEGMCMQPVSCGEALVGASSNMDSWPCGHWCMFMFGVELQGGLARV